MAKEGAVGVAEDEGTCEPAPAKIVWTDGVTAESASYELELRTGAIAYVGKPPAGDAAAQAARLNARRSFKDMMRG